MTLSIDTQHNHIGTLRAIMQIIVLLCFALFYCYAVCHCAECHYAKCHYAECYNAESHDGGTHFGDCHYAECHYAECHRSAL
jgi:hypothetical protein